ncbi:MAG: hypothetical protein WDW38_005248 [Sanguina aurantia]
MTSYFSVITMLIIMRETMEVSIIIAIMLQLMTRLNLAQLRRQVWLGAIAGVVISISLGVIFIAVFYVAQKNLFSGDSEAKFKGSMSWIAAVLVTVLAFAMLRFYTMEARMKTKLQNATLTSMQTSQRWPIFILACTAVFREGIETVVFLAGISTEIDAPANSMPAAVVVGIILGIIVGAVVYYTGRSIQSIFWFFAASCIFMLFIGAGLVPNGTHEFAEAGVFGVFEVEEGSEEQLSWSNTPLYDWSGCCSSDEDTTFFGFMRTLFGYYSSPTKLMVLLYWMYWTGVLCLLAWKLFRGTLYGILPGSGAPPPDLESCGSANSSNDQIKGAGELEAASTPRALGSLESGGSDSDSQRVFSASGAGPKVPPSA